MARKRTMNRSDLRAQAEAAEARDADKEKDEEEEVEEEADDAGDDDSGDDEDGAPKKKKPKAKKPAAPKKKAAPRKKVVKEVRMRAVWVVLDNGSKRLKEFAYPNKADAEKFMAERAEEKKGTYYIQLVKEPLEEK
jgi:cell wall-associated NlpC family hydrolase